MGSPQISLKRIPRFIRPLACVRIFFLKEKKRLGRGGEREGMGVGGGSGGTARERERRAKGGEEGRVSRKDSKRKNMSDACRWHVWGFKVSEDPRVRT